MMSEIALSLGSNLGRRLANLKRARRMIAALPGVRIAACSAAYETEPVDVPAEFRRRRFLNAVLVVTTALPPVRLAAALRRIERALGRDRAGRRRAPRPIDIDVICAGRRRIRTRRLTVPHPCWAARRFVVRPLAEVRPGLRLPGEGRAVRAVLLALPLRPKVVLYRRRW